MKQLLLDVTNGIVMAGFVVINYIMVYCYWRIASNKEGVLSGKIARFLFILDHALLIRY